MARRSRMSILKRQRELKKSEKASRKRAKRHGLPEEPMMEPRPTVGAAEFHGEAPEDEVAEGPANPEEGEPQAEARESEPA